MIWDVSQRSINPKPPYLCSGGEGMTCDLPCIVEGQVGYKKIPNLEPSSIRL